MARIKKNKLVEGASGNVGKQFVYKQRGKETHIALMPVFDKNAPITEKQEQVRESFSEASMYATSAMNSPELKKEYQKKASSTNNAYNIALRDYLKSPVVKLIDKDSYDGTPGSTIVIKAKDDFRVAAVKVSVHTADGVLIEDGNAILDPINRNKWNYTAVQANAPLAGSVIKAIAKDIPGNTGSREITL
jgi:hypothetical protein